MVLMSPPAGEFGRARLVIAASSPLSEMAKPSTPAKAKVREIYYPPYHEQRIIL
jgi:hypothetical protein